MDFENFVNKILSGRFIMTVAVTVTLCLLALKSRVESDDFMKIALIVTYAYFTRKRDDNES